MENILHYKDNNKITNILITFLGSTMYAIGIKWFIAPAGQKPGGFPGIASLLSDLSSYLFDFAIPIGLLWPILNIPVFFLAFKGVGRRFTFLSLLAVIFGSLALLIIPIPQDLINEGISNDYMLSAITGGVITGVGVGITLKVGASTGGMDIISQYLSLRRNGSFGMYSFVLNALIIIVVGFTDRWEIALYTIINLFIANIVVDKIHTRHNKLTLMIVTDFKDEIVAALHKRIYRGITLIPAMGSFTKKDKSILFMVVTSYELYNVIATIREIDSNAFTNVIKSHNVFGNFFKSKLD